MARRSRKKRQNILVILWAAEESARDFYAGFMKHARSKDDWDVHVVYQLHVDWEHLNRSLAAGEYDGIVLTDTALAAHADLAVRPELAMIVFGALPQKAVPMRCSCYHVAVNNEELGGGAVRFFMRLGNFRAFGFVPPPLSEPWSVSRAEGFLRELARHGRTGSVFGRDRPLGEWLEALPKPAAVMAASDYVALDVLTTCRSRNLVVPGCVCVLGVDNERYLCESARPPLTSLIPCHVEAGYEVARALGHRLRKGAPTKDGVTVCHGYEIRERDSTMPLSPVSHLLQAALSYIRENVTKDLGVDDVVEHLGVSRRLADLRFREFQGETILQAITRMRLEEVAKRLLASNLSIGKVAVGCGFSDVSYLARLFRRRYGLSMREWRRNPGQADMTNRA